MGRRNLLLFVCLVLFFIIIFVMKTNKEEDVDPNTLEVQSEEIKLIDSVKTV